MAIRSFIIPLICILTALCNIQISFSQTRQIDSLKLALTNPVEDSNRVNTLYDLGEKFWERYDYQNTVKYTGDALTLAKKIKFVTGEFKALMCLGNVNAYKSKISEAHKYFSAAIELSTQTGNKKAGRNLYRDRFLLQTCIEIPASF